MFIVSEIKPVAGVHHKSLQRFDFRNGERIFTDIGRSE